MRKDLPVAGDAGRQTCSKPTTRLGCDFGRSPRGQWKTQKKKFGGPFVLCSRHRCQFRNGFADCYGFWLLAQCGLSLRIAWWLVLCVPGFMLTG